jgi:hypothetical protein
MEAKMVKAKRARLKLADKIRIAEEHAYEEGRTAGAADEQRKHLPNWQHQKNITDFVRMIDSWGNMSEEAIIMIAGTDLKAHATGAIPLRLFKVVGEELKRLGYKP